MSDDPKHQESLSMPGRCRSCLETWPCQVERLRTDLAAANATIAAHETDLAATAELLLREQALAESQALALATMREAAEAYLQGSTPCSATPSGVAAGRAARVALRAILAQPASDAAALAGAVLEAADELDAAAKHVDLVGHYSQSNHKMPAALVHPMERLFKAQQAYRRARAALRGGGSGEGG